MSRSAWYCHNPLCDGTRIVQRKLARFCPDCGGVLDQIPFKKDEVQNPTPPKPEFQPESTSEKEKPVENKKSYPWLWIILVVLAIVAAVFITQLVIGNQQEKALLTERLNQAEANYAQSLQEDKLAQAEANAALAEQQKAYQAELLAQSEADAARNNQPKPEANNQEIIVFRGKTDQETIDYNDAWPGFYSYETFNWFDNRGFSNIHLKGGNYVMPCNGVISGDVMVNGKEIYDNNRYTFLVINVKAGDIVYVPDWQARFTNELSIDTVVRSVQTQFPTWTRQESDLNR